ncbi:MAG: DUF6291 domain-containing protein [Rikenellaceae bacterium]
MSSEKRESFIFYESFFQAIDKMDIAEQLPIYRAITEYALYHTEPDFKGMGAIVWALIKPQLDANWKRYSNGCGGAKHGSKGGAPKGNTNAQKKGKQPQNNPSGVNKTTPNVNDNVNENNNENVEGINRTAKRFTPPSFDEVREYITQKGYTINPQSFIDYYTSSGWKLSNGNPMRDWQATLRNWSRQDDGNRATRTNPNQEPQKFTESYELL